MTQKHINAYNISRHIKTGGEIGLSPTETLISITNTKPSIIPLPEETFILLKEYGETYTGTIQGYNNQELSLLFAREEFRSIQDCVYQILDYNKCFDKQ